MECGLPFNAKYFRQTESGRWHVWLYVHLKDIKAKINVKAFVILKSEVRKMLDTIKQGTFFLSFFLSLSDLFYLPAVGIQCYSCTSSHSVTHARAHTHKGEIPLPKDRPVKETTQHSQEQDIHAPSGTRPRNFSKRAAADLRLGLKAETVREIYSVLTMVCCT